MSPCCNSPNSKQEKSQKKGSSASKSLLPKISIGFNQIIDVLDRMIVFQIDTVLEIAQIFHSQTKHDLNDQQLFVDGEPIDT